MLINKLIENFVYISTREIQTSDELNSVSGLRRDIATLRKEIDENNCVHRKQLDDKQQENEKLKAEVLFV